MCTKTHDLRALHDALDEDTRNRIEQKTAAKWMDSDQTGEWRRHGVAGGGFVRLGVIKEAKRAPTPIALDRLDDQGWTDVHRGKA